MATESVTDQQAICGDEIEEEFLRVWCQLDVTGKQLTMIALRDMLREGQGCRS